MKKLAADQQGMSGMSFAFIMVLVVFVVAIGLKMLPIYIEYFSVRSVLGSLQNDESLTTDNIKSTMMRNFMINDVDNVGRQHIKIERKANKRIVTVAYEVRKPLMGNVDIVVNFSDSVELK